MKKKNLILTAVVAVMVIGGAAFALKTAKDDGSQGATTAGPANQTPTVGEDTAQPARTAQKTGEHGNYVTLADYNKSKGDYNDDKKVLFFHAPWCPVCQSIDKEINADPGKIPGGDVIIKTDFDSETELRKKHGVTYQYTFVQIDNSGQQIKKWTATTLDDVISQIE
ncbi:MAG TPA: thioredoxin family protein [Candidatus Saccharimonadales bacterium]|nr:thioredoxin family protein [Candidatus Saccharimonadales bacterium]